jgi:hypothetical protein
MAPIQAVLIIAYSRPFTGEISVKAHGDILAPASFEPTWLSARNAHIFAHVACIVLCPPL